MIASLDELDQQDAFYSADYQSDAIDADSERDSKLSDSDGESDSTQIVSASLVALRPGKKLLSRFPHPSSTRRAQKLVYRQMTSDLYEIRIFASARI